MVSSEVGKCHIYFDNSLFLFCFVLVCSDKQGSNTAEVGGGGTSASAVSWSKEKKRPETLCVYLVCLVCEVDREETDQRIN